MGSARTAGSMRGSVAPTPGSGLDDSLPDASREPFDERACHPSPQGAAGIVRNMQPPRSDEAANAMIGILTRLVSAGPAEAPSAHPGTDGDPSKPEHKTGVVQ